MNAIAFDTHAHVKRLVGSGLTEDQAEAVVDAVRQTADLPDLSHLATKVDLQEVKAALQEFRTTTKADLQTLKLELRAEIAEVRGEMKGLRGELIWWIIGSSTVVTLAHYFIK